MPARNIVKQYLENGYYHVYNRGVEKRTIFQDEQDYLVFLHLLKFYLSPPDTQILHPLTELTGFNPVRLRPFFTLDRKLDLLAYCLMPNHFHLLLKQITLHAMTELLRKISTTYAMYFNKKYKRVGHLFQGAFKGVLIDNDAYLLHLSRYIHLNGAELTGSDPVSYPYSSYGYYLGLKNASWIKPKFILDYFKSNNSLMPKEINSYRKFVEESLLDSSNILGSLVLEDD